MHALLYLFPVSVHIIVHGCTARPGLHTDVAGILVTLYKLKMMSRTIQPVVMLLRAILVMKTVEIF